MTQAGNQHAYTYIPSLWHFSSSKEIGWVLPYWGVSISNTQLNANQDGLDPDYHADLIAHIVTRGIRISLNKYGLIDIHRVGMYSRDMLF